MRKIIVTGFIVALCLLIIPLPLIKGGSKGVTSRAASAKAGESSAVIDTAAGVSESEVVFRIKTENGIENIPADEYITGVVAAEMPASYGIEALKAQCVAAYSFALCRRAARKGEDYDLTDSYKTDQSYLSEAALKEKWGDTYEEKISKIKQAVSGVSGQYLSYGGEPALTLYHALSGGTTNACADVFGGARPYLISVKSEADKLSPDYKSVFSFNAQEIKQKLTEIEAAPDGENLFSSPEFTDSGYVKSIVYGNTEVSGSRVAALLGLSSGNFTVEYGGGAYTFTCFGHGHGVGMSQYGAGRLAAGGSGYAEILNFYYPGTEIKK